MITTALRRAFRFFHKHAGYGVGRRAQGALALARAEAAARDMGLTFEWEWDPCPDLSWMSEAERRKDHEVLRCIVRTADGEPLNSLWGIVDADESYRRVVEAELAMEALTTLRGEQRVRNRA